MTVTGARVFDGGAARQWNFARFSSGVLIACGDDVTRPVDEVVDGHTHLLPCRS